MQADNSISASRISRRKVDTYHNTLYHNTNDEEISFNAVCIKSPKHKGLSREQCWKNDYPTSKKNTTIE